MKFASFVFAFIVCTFISCNNLSSKQEHTDSATATAKDSSTAATTTPLSEREKLIKALQQLQQDVANRNKETIAAYFTFPVDNDVLQAYDVNESFDKQLTQNNHLVTRPLFLTHFDALYENLEMHGFSELFSHLQLEKLKDTTGIQTEENKATEVCAHFYSISIEGKEVTLQYGVYTNEAYTGKHSKDDPLECPEYAAFWTFTFMDGKLIFNRRQVAG